MRERKSARWLIVSPEDNLLLFRFSHDQGALAGSAYWATPGGAVKVGETFEAAAERELYEETGIRVTEVGAFVGERNFPMQLADGERIEARERYYFARVEGEHVVSAHWTAQECEVIATYRWWPLADLQVTTETVWPTGVFEMLTVALAADHTRQMR